MMNIPIVVVAHKRPMSLKRLLKSLDKAVLNDPVELILSVDKSNNPEVLQIAQDFQWRFGGKRVISHTTNLGLRKHILSCGDLVEDYDGIIILEDDLYVSPFFYEYSVKALDYYKDDSKLAGVSLYSHYFNETAYLPFQPFPDNSALFFMQIPSSWGQCWTKKQWMSFKQWYNDNADNLNEFDDLLIPIDVLGWPASSWKKHFFYYMINQNLFFAYPRLSLTSNFSDPGTHIRSKKHIFQVPLQYFPQNYHFIDLQDSVSVYDACCEILPDRLKKLSPQLNKYDLEVDLYGVKPLKKIKADYLVSIKQSDSPVLTFGREMKPIECNVIENIDGVTISLGHISSFKDKKYRKYSLNELMYFYNMVEYLHLSNIFEELKKKLNPKEADPSEKTSGEKNNLPMGKFKFFYLRVINLIKLHKYKLPLVVFCEMRKVINNK